MVDLACRNPLAGGLQQVAWHLTGGPFMNTIEAAQPADLQPVLCMN